MEGLKAIMRYALTIGVSAVLAAAAFAATEDRKIPPPKSQHPVTRDVCDHKSRDWSTMRQTLVASSHFRG
jgi:hypothetical protein